MLLFGPADRKSIIQAYEAFRSDTRNDILSSLPPFYCKSIVDRFDELPSTRSSAICGALGAKHDEIKPLSLPGSYEISFLSGLAGQLALEWGDLKKCDVIEATDQPMSLVKNVIVEFGKYFPAEATLICDVTSSIVWLDATSAGFTGAALHEFPHCTFLTDAAMYVITPSFLVSREISKYALFENLFHESLHHQLSAAAILYAGGYLLPNCQDAKTLKVKSRDKDWSLPNILQAAYVYINLINLRKSYLYWHSDNISSSEIVSIQNAIEHATSVSEELTVLLHANKNMFLPAWHNFLEEIREFACQKCAA